MGIIKWHSFFDLSNFLFSKVGITGLVAEVAEVGNGVVTHV